jgi:hypothetical protein
MTPMSRTKAETDRWYGERPDSCRNAGKFTYADDEALGCPCVEAGEVGRVEGDQAAHRGEARRRRARVRRLRRRHGAAKEAQRQQEHCSVAAGGGARPRLHFSAQITVFSCVDGELEIFFPTSEVELLSEWAPVERNRSLSRRKRCWL